MSLLKQVGLHGKRAFIDQHDKLVGRGGLAAGGVDKPSIVYPGPDVVAKVEDFIGDAIPAEWTPQTTDTGQLVSIQAFTNGVARALTSASSTQTPIGGAVGIGAPAEWKANQGNLRMSWRGKISALSGENVFVGFTDSGGAELPVYDTGGGVLTPAADYVGFLYTGAVAAAAGDKVWRFVAGKAGADQVASTGSVAPTANVYVALEVDVSSDGNLARGYINGKQVATIASAAVTPTVALAPVAIHSNTEAAAVALDTDWINVSANRDTGE